MQLDETDIREFKELWEREFGETLSDETSREYASNLLTFFTVLAEPLPSEQGTSA
jgi:hypothetical protein